jgi:serine/threonine protein kinase
MFSGLSEKVQKISRSFSPKLMFDIAGNMTSISAGTVIDKYQLIRLIGEGGFGSVWLAYSEILANHCALKILHHSDGASSRRELQAVQAYKKLAIGGVASGLIPIEHVGQIERRLFYVMPLADGLGGRAPSHPEWKPLTLAARLAQQANQPAFFTSDEIAGWFSTICKGIQVLSDAGLVHRDIKPDNILFIQGMPVVSDVSLLTNDAAQGTRYGTPGFSAPSWYVDTGGKEDMYGIATTLFTALTGNSPDRMGRAAFQWPPQGQGSLSQSEQREWRRLHRIILRATHEKVAERFVTFSALAAAFGKVEEPAPKPQALVLVPAPAPDLALSPKHEREKNVSDDRLAPFAVAVRGLFPPLPLIGLIAIFFLTAILLDLFVFRKESFYMSCAASVVAWYLFFRGAEHLGRDWGIGGELLRRKLFTASVIVLVFIWLLSPFVVDGQTSITQQEEGWWWWYHIKEVAHVDATKVAYINCGVAAFLFVPAYAMAPFVCRLLSRLRR